MLQEIKDSWQYAYHLCFVNFQKRKHILFFNNNNNKQITTWHVRNTLQDTYIPRLLLTFTPTMRSMYKMKLLWSGWGVGMRQFAWGWSHGRGRCNNNSKASLIGKYNHMVQGDPHPLNIVTLCFYCNTVAHGLPTCPGPFVLYRCVVVVLPVMCIPDTNDRVNNLDSVLLVIWSK